MTLSYSLGLATAAVVAAITEIGIGPIHVGCTSIDNVTGGCLGGGFVKYRASTCLVLVATRATTMSTLGGGALVGAVRTALGLDMMMGMQGKAKQVLNLILVQMDGSPL